MWGRGATGLAEKRKDMWNDVWLDHAGFSNVFSFIHRAHICKTYLPDTFL